MKSWLAYGKVSVTARRSTSQMITYLSDTCIQAVKVSATSNASGESYNDSHPIRQKETADVHTYTWYRRKTYHEFKDYC